MKNRNTTMIKLGDKERKKSYLTSKNGTSNSNMKS